MHYNWNIVENSIKHHTVGQSSKIMHLQWDSCSILYVYVVFLEYNFGGMFECFWDLKEMALDFFLFLVCVWWFSICIKKINPFPNNKWQILDSSKVKQFADDNFRFDENGRKFF